MANGGARRMRAEVLLCASWWDSHRVTATMRQTELCKTDNECVPVRKGSPTWQITHNAQVCFEGQHIRVRIQGRLYFPQLKQNFWIMSYLERSSLTDTDPVHLPTSKVTSRAKARLPLPETTCLRCSHKFLPMLTHGSWTRDRETLVRFLNRSATKCEGSRHTSKDIHDHPVRTRELAHAEPASGFRDTDRHS